MSVAYDSRLKGQLSPKLWELDEVLNTRRGSILRRGGLPEEDPRDEELL
jgi:hypothetical protein